MKICTFLYYTMPMCGLGHRSSLEKHFHRIWFWIGCLDNLFLCACSKDSSCWRSFGNTGKNTFWFANGSEGELEDWTCRQNFEHNSCMKKVSPLCEFEHVLVEARVLRSFCRKCDICMAACGFWCAFSKQTGRCNPYCKICMRMSSGSDWHDVVLDAWWNQIELKILSCSLNKSKVSWRG